MNRNTIIALGIILFGAASCSKNELRSEEIYTEPGIETTPTVSSAAVSGWQQATEWSSPEQNNALQSGRIGSAGISADIADNGLVLVFTKKGEMMQSLPYTDGDIYWNYQVEQGKVVINASATSAAKIDRQQAFQYVMFSKEQLDMLETKGMMKNELINLSYNQAMQIAAGK